jgi:ElaB/YqjD/DUF883 family membrane-anchored ribosome-binding protein
MDRPNPPYSTERDQPTTEATAAPRGNDATHQADALGETAARVRLERPRVAVRDAVDKTREKMAAYRQGGIEKVSKDIVEYTRSQPMTALLIATGIGLVTGILVGSGRK